MSISATYERDADVLEVADSDGRAVTISGYTTQPHATVVNTIARRMDVSESTVEDAIAAALRSAA